MTKQKTIDLAPEDWGLILLSLEIAIDAQKELPRPSRDREQAPFAALHQRITGLFEEKGK